jgi:hypothetical protein
MALGCLLIVIYGLLDAVDLFFALLLRRLLMLLPLYLAFAFAFAFTPAISL